MARSQLWSLNSKAVALVLPAYFILAMFGSSPAPAFELFGIKLFGSDNEAEEAGIVDPVPYTANLALNGVDRELLDKLKDASLLIRMEKVPPSGLIGLIARARDDQANLIAKLYEEARYGGVVTIFIGGKRLENMSFTDQAATREGKIAVTITVSPGPEFRFGNIRVDGGDPQQAAADAGLMRGGFCFKPNDPRRRNGHREGVAKGRASLCESVGPRSRGGSRDQDGGCLHPGCPWPGRNTRPNDCRRRAGCRC